MNAPFHRLSLLGSITFASMCLQCGSSQPHPSTSAGAGGNEAGSGNLAGGMTDSGNGGTGAGGPPVSFGGAVTAIPGGPGCGLADAAAFCDSFDAASATKGRAGELDPLKWSAARQQPQAPTGGNIAIGITAATLPACRSGLATTVFPDGDTVICDPTTAIRSNHLLMAAAAQNYGQNSYRIRQPFDFAGRTGKIVFDAEARTIQLLGWISLEVSEDPTPGPSFALGVENTANDEGSVVPRNAFELQFQNNCNSKGDAVGLRSLLIVKNYVQTEVSVGEPPVCIKTKEGHLNHIEVAVSQSRIEIFATPYSEDGSKWEAPVLLFGADVSLPFSRAYVNITAHNHATKKYSEPPLDAWLARWDNVAFDGPVITGDREYEIPDSLVPSKQPFGTEQVKTIAYLVAESTGAPKDTLHFKGVDPSGMSKARLAISGWYQPSEKNATYALKFRLNGGAWHDRPFTADEVKVLSDSHCQGAIAQMIDVPIDELVKGDNSLEFLALNIPQNVPPAVSNIDLILSK